MALPISPSKRKEFPLYSGLFAYFPDALAYVANVSYVGNVQHNGEGSPLQWTRKKSSDHPDCELRHLVDRGKRDEDNVLHSAKRAWRALADLQIELEELGLGSPPPAAVDNE